MHFIIHLLSTLSIVIGFLIFCYLPFKKKTAFILICLIGGIAIGSGVHIFLLDGPAYGIEGFTDRCVYLKEYEPHPWKYSLCIAIMNREEPCIKYKGVDENERT